MCCSGYIVVTATNQIVPRSTAFVSNVIFTNLVLGIGMQGESCRLCITELKFGKRCLLLKVGESRKSYGRNKSDWLLFDRVGHSVVSAISGVCQRKSISWGLSWDEHLVVASDKLYEIVAAHNSASDATDVDGPRMSRSEVRIVIWTTSER